MPKVVCRFCYHPEEVHRVNDTGECGCGCIKLVPIDRDARAARKRTWVVSVSLFVKNRWIESCEFRVRSIGVANAAALALRQAKRECLKPRTRVAQYRIAIVPVPQSRLGISPGR